MISVTDLSSYLYCQRKLYLQNVLGFYEPPKEALARGKVRHCIYENITLSEQKLVESIKEDDLIETVKERFRNKYRELVLQAIKIYKKELERFDVNVGKLFKGIWPMIADEAESRADFVYDFSSKNKLFGKELWEKITPKIKTEYKVVSEKLGVKGIIDRLEVYEKRIVPIELKTGSSPKEGIWPNHRVQIAAYAMLLEDKFGTAIKEAIVEYLDAKEKRRLHINAFLRSEVLELIERVKLLLDGKEPPKFEENKNKCAKCGIRDKCHDEETIRKKIEEINHC